MKQPSLPNAPRLRPLAEVVAIAIEDLSVELRSDIRALCEAVKHRATASEWLRWGEQNLIQGVRGVLRSKGADGLPKAVHVRGGYHAPQQLTFPDYVEWAYDMAKRGREMNERAREIAAICAEKTGRTFDADVVIQAAAVGEDLSTLVARLVA